MSLDCVTGKKAIVNEEIERTWDIIEHEKYWSAIAQKEYGLVKIQQHKQ